MQGFWVGFPAYRSRPAEGRNGSLSGRGGKRVAFERFDEGGDEGEDEDEDEDDACAEAD